MLPKPDKTGILNGDIPPGYEDCMIPESCSPPISPKPPIIFPVRADESATPWRLNSLGWQSTL